MWSTTARTLRRRTVTVESRAPAWWIARLSNMALICGDPSWLATVMTMSNLLEMFVRAVFASAPPMGKGDSPGTRRIGPRSPISLPMTFPCSRLDPEATKMKRPHAHKASSTSVDLSALAECVEQFPSRTIVLFGDFVADEFQYGEISRVSREAPVLILKHRETQLVPGGGANAANNLASLGARVLPVTVVGNDAAGDALTEYFRGLGVDTSGIVRVPNWTTPTKTRFLAGWAHTTAQQVLRVDREPGVPVPDKAKAQVGAKLVAKLRGAHALAVSDYGFGASSPRDLRKAVQSVR